jgi:RNA polymerase sigma-70 factor (ECF subfamily)
MNQQSSGTRLSLVVRLKDARDHAAWTEFVAIYEPLILRMLGRNGLQESDARDVSQQVLAAVAKDVERWRPDGREASFRRWLFRIAKNRVIKFLDKQRKHGVAATLTGGSNIQRALDAEPDRSESLSAVFEREYRQQLLRQAADEIRAEFRDSTWQAFWQSSIDGRTISEVAGELGMSRGAAWWLGCEPESAKSVATRTDAS